MRPFPRECLHGHAKGLHDLREGTPDRSKADDAACLPGQFSDWVIEAGENRGFRPLGVFRSEEVDFGAQGQKERRRVLGDAGCGVAGNVADYDPLGPGGCEIDDIDTGGGHEDEFEFRELGKDFRVKDDLVGDEDLLAMRAGEHFVRRGDRVMGKVAKLVES